MSEDPDWIQLYLQWNIYLKTYTIHFNYILSFIQSCFRYFISFIYLSYFLLFHYFWKDSDAGRDWGQEEKGTTEDEMAGWHHWLDGPESEWTPGVGDGPEGLACCDSWGRKESDTTERLIWSDLIWLLILYNDFLLKDFFWAWTISFIVKVKVPLGTSFSLGVNWKLPIL